MYIHVTTAISASKKVCHVQLTLLSNIIKYFELSMFTSVESITGKIKFFIFAKRGVH